MKVNVLTPIRFGGPFKWGQDLVPLLNKNGVQAKHIHTLFNLSKSCLYENADIVHTTVPIPFKLWQKPIVFTVHVDYSIERNIWQRFYPKTIAETSVVTTPSQYLKRKLGLEKAVVIPNALFPERFKPVHYGTRDELNLLSVMNFYFFDKVKGLLNIIEVLNKTQNQRFNYTVIGGGQYLDTIKHHIAGAKVAVKFTGFLPDPKPTLAASDIFLYYSYQDNFPIVILEAMASGLPVITNNIGAVSEIIDEGENGYIAENDETYLECLLNLLNSPDLRQNIGLKARQTVERKFDWEKVVSSYIGIYKAVL